MTPSKLQTTDGHNTYNLGDKVKLRSGRLIGDELAINIKFIATSTESWFPEIMLDNGNYAYLSQIEHAN